ncbi:MAG: UDP-N-acetylmuramoylalanyl-D-glutamyl-2, 6-diaminopimelate--D-alanyl-D-alanine ligase [Sulfurimonas sp. RIFOXYD12_FULL_33_39]|uniref:Mur ligase family protein n=1 Tax=unclassified Sulfurimonas TaxID=2623549 RepID=UPI0008B45E0F|nr:MULTISPECIES: UDP-N-acetylmuramoyl-tripeptide--D-alanyl-D-alanine ligase [unclassified Sulfurimonas]OHE03780.1 MAG: UDP-N-acetylmuramoylalanyl-D-glutamyl-2, 6-diaminopimelate--D-alanyl-D-alanine ligase [Sulfurimonas sp. RIFCSPLOWO2_12_FULL_34_6]OHE09485.1 MAG: UDP-N-acetylmuramoylalanyl-D-glutamyl-2, 6-diaminopimelate--D-alanyl-D-alanine ligase [Sulfurimonas sp. RIFOXYD12_FULL_33_39]OHE12734.1 MAG: UDP-N-acetylmuramoylalanyl-D-glutamyl-2, 6-diaminopimelate--D-alanyl-D-alanine ligase [Sulfurim
MQNYEILVAFVTNILFVTVLGWYLITNLQWYDYKLSRVVLKHHKPHWHIIYFLIPFGAYYMTGEFFIIFFIFAVLPAIFIWYKNLDKKLVLTWRVKRFLILLVSLTLFQDILCTIKDACEIYGVFMPLAVAYVGSVVIEKFLFAAFKKEAKKKLKNMNKLQIVTITGSYGKTSIKNFVREILSKKYKVYATPRSVNTIGGIIKDVNESLPLDTEIYICEAGARESGDIYEITTFLEPQSVVVGKVGLAHVEYFKSLKNIIATKLEIMQSPKLERAFIHTSVTDEPHDKVTFFGDEVQNIDANLDGTNFELKINDNILSLHTNILGSFQTMNIAVAVRIAKAFGMSDEEIIKAVGRLTPVEHRLQKITAGGKIILDDGYNGNIDGMLEAVRLCSLHEGRKVIVTPGLVESSDELNLKLIKAINDVFDIVIVTGALNAELFDKNLNVKNKIMLADKSALTDVLGIQTKAGDIILFANDAPNFI